ncbi:MAG TPA: hypothetical protein PKX00_13025 [Opitutaceae bacterium]|nr:hypothetical protein [Opitutaceae bacterium]
MLAALDPLQRLATINDTAKTRLIDARAAVLASPGDAKLVNAFRSAHASVAADADLAAAAAAHIRDKREAIILELAPSLVDLGNRALEIIDERLKAEGFSIRTGHARPDEGRLIEHRSEEIPCPNTSLGLMLLEFRERIQQALGWRNSTPAVLENIIGIIETSPI